MTDADDLSIGELREQTSKGDRLDEAPRQQRQAGFKQSIREHLAAIDAGERQKTVSVRDGDLAAFINALEDNPEDMEAVGEALRNALGVEGNGEPDRSEVLRLALNLGFREAAPAYVEALRETVRDRAVEGV